MGNIEYRIQLKDTAPGKFGANIITAGGTVMVCNAGRPTKATIVDKDGAAMTNPLTPTRGFINFFTADTATSGVDLYILYPGGQFKVAAGVIASGPNEIGTDTAIKDQIYKIPFSITDSVAATEKDTGFDLPATCKVLDRLQGMGILVTVLDATEDIDFGLLSTESGGDADGFNVASDLDNARLVTGTNGALFSTNAPHNSDSVTAKSISYTLTTGTDTAQGFILLPVQLV